MYACRRVRYAEKGDEGTRRERGKRERERLNNSRWISSPIFYHQVASLQYHPHDPAKLLSASHDGTLRCLDLTKQVCGFVWERAGGGGVCMYI